MLNYFFFCKFQTICCNLTLCIFLSLISIVALVYYLRSAWTNPGYLKGEMRSDDPKHHIPTLNGKPMTEEDRAAAST